MAARKPRRRHEVEIESLPDGSAVLYDGRQKKAYPLTRSGAAIWQACDGTRTRATIVTDLEEVYDAPRETIERDVEAFLRQLAELELLEAAPET